MILAAGRGERLRPLTDTTPKPLLRAGKARLIEYHLHSLAASGIRDIVINIGHLGEQIPALLGDGDRYGLALRYSDETTGVLETGGGICKALPMLESDPFLVVNGDIWTDYDLRRLPHRIDGLAHLLLVPNPEHNPAGDFGLDKNGQVTDKQAGLPSYTFSGIGLYRHELFAGCRPEPFPLAGLLRRQLASGRVSGQLIDARWMDIGTAERLAELSRRLAR
jgi:MurNAc alpha-1-phosphate uridylyltransferase